MLCPTPTIVEAKVFSPIEYESMKTSGPVKNRTPICTNIGFSFSDAFLGRKIFRIMLYRSYSCLTSRLKASTLLCVSLVSCACMNSPPGKVLSQRAVWGNSRILNATLEFFHDFIPRLTVMTPWKFHVTNFRVVQMMQCRHSRLDKSDGRFVKFEECLRYFYPKLQPSPPVNGSFAVDSENRVAPTLFFYHIMKIVSLNLPVSV